MSEAQRIQDMLDRESFFGGLVGVLPGTGGLLPSVDQRVGFKRLTNSAILPVRAHATDSGFDLFADEDITLLAGDCGVLIRTGIAVQLPPGYEAQVRPRSGISHKSTLRVVLGTVDNAYRGEISVIIDNIAAISYDTQLEIDFDTLEIVGVDLHEDDYSGAITIEKGSKIAQLVVSPYYIGSSYEVKDELSQTDRGSNGFGSTGNGLVIGSHALEV